MRLFLVRLGAVREGSVLTVYLVSHCNNGLLLWVALFVHDGGHAANGGRDLVAMAL